MYRAVHSDGCVSGVSLSLSLTGFGAGESFLFMVARNVYDTTSGSSSMAFRFVWIFGIRITLVCRERGKNEDG